MSTRNNDFDRAIRGALSNVRAVWTPQCPEPETLLDWIEQEGAHPQARFLFDHYTACAYCRREYAAIRETWMLAKELEPTGRDAATPQRDTRSARSEGRVERPSLPRAVATWLHELIEEGIATPIKSVRAALELMDRLKVPSSLALTRGGDTPVKLDPAFTAIRSCQPTLRWVAEEPAGEYVVVVTRQIDRHRRQPQWKQSAEANLALTLPEQAGLEPGGIYLWQVIARTGQREAPSAPVGFSVITEPMKRRLEELEAGLDARPEQGVGENTPLALIALYEAFGLYREALQLVQEGIRLHGDDSTLLKARDRLLSQWSQ